MSSCDEEDNYMQNQEFHHNINSSLSRLSIESFDADGEFSDDEDKVPPAGPPAVYSLPVTPLEKRRNHIAPPLMGHFMIKHYVSDNENGQKTRRNERRRRRKKRVFWRKANGDENDEDFGAKKMEMSQYYGTSFSGGDNSSENGRGSRVIITRPKGGRSSLCMDMEEVKACRELGFELELPSRLNVSPVAAIDTTSSGGSSPISGWRISSPGDDPKDVKARLKVWAQAVALVSTSPQMLSS